MKTFLVALCGVAIGAGSAGAATNFNKGREDVNPVNGINDTSDWDWMDSANWSTGLVPVDGDEVKFVRIDHNTPIGLDTNGANMNLPTSKLTGVSSVSAASIAVNFNRGAGDALGAGETTGVVAQGNWNNRTGGVLDNLMDDGGIATTMDVTATTQQGAWDGEFPAWTDAADNKLMNSYLYQNGATGGTTITVAVAQVPYALYDVYVYVGVPLIDRGGSVALTNSAVTYFAKSSGLAEDTFIRATDTGPWATTPNGGNYVRFENVTGTDFTMTATADELQTYVRGIQVVQVPEPASAFDGFVTDAGLDPASTGQPHLDPDFDSLQTGIEWVVGGNPNSSTSDTDKAPTGATVIADRDGDQTPSAYLLFTYRRTDEANLDEDTTIAVEYGSNLTGWSTATDDVDGVDIYVTDEGFDTGVDRVEVFIPTSLAASGKLFARLNVAISAP